MKKILSTALTCALLAGCGGGGGTSVTPGTPTSGGSKTAQATLHFKFNNSKSISGSMRGRNYISRNTLGLGISFRPTGTSAVTFGTTETALQSPMWTTNVNPSYNSNLTTCTAADLTTGAFTCTVVITVPAGYDDFQITTWDAAPQTLGTNGTFASTANDLSTAIVGNQYVQVNASNVFNYALSGVVNSVVLTPSVSQLVSGATLGATDAGGNLINPASVTLSVLAKDFDGNIIIGNDQYVDVNGTPVTINVSKGESDGSTGTAAPADGNVTFASATGATNQVPSVANSCAATSCTFNSPGTISLAYDGYDTQSATFSANVTGGATVNAIGSQIAFTQSGNGLGVPGPLTLNVEGPGTTPCAPNAGPLDGGRGPDGLVYFAEPCGIILQVQPNGTVTELYAPGSTPNAVIAGPDGLLWIVDQGSNQIATMRTDGSGGQTYPGPAPAVQMLGSLPEGITVGTDNRLWFTENTGGYIGVMNADGTIYAQYPVGGNPYKITAGPGGYWYTDRNAATVVQIDSSGTVLHTVTSATSGTTTMGIVCTVASPCYLGSPEGITVGADGNVWVADFERGIVKITPAGDATIYPAPSGSSPQSIVAGPDGNVWFTLVDATATQDGVGRITPAGNVTMYTNPALPDGNTLGITSGADGNVYFSNFVGGTITQVVL